MNARISIIAASIVVALIVMVSATGFAASGGQCPEGSRKMTVADSGIVMYMGDPCIPVQKLKASPPRRMTVADAGMDAYHFERFTAGTEGPLNEKIETTEIGGTVYRIGIDMP
jgi:hypothetical protein